MITKREWHLISVVVFLLVMIIGGVFNFLAITENNGQMPFLTQNPYWQDMGREK